jgi:hypothetical protein
MAAISLGVSGAVGSCGFHVLRLDRCGRLVLLMRCDLLLRGGLMLNAARTAVVGHVTVVHDRGVVNDGFVHVGVGDYGAVHVDDRSVIGKRAAPPLTAGETDTHVAEAVVHAAVVAHMRAPIAGMKQVLAAAPTPPRRGPQQADSGGGHPGTGNPVVAVGAISPVTRGPHEIGLGAYGLNVDRKHWRRKADGDADTELSVG